MFFMELAAELFLFGHDYSLVSDGVSLTCLFHSFYGFVQGEDFVSDAFNFLPQKRLKAEYCYKTICHRPYSFFRALNN